MTTDTEKAVVVPTSVDSMADGDLLDEILVLRGQKAKLKKETEAVDSRQKEIEVELLSRMRTRKTDRIANSSLSASITKSTQPTVKDWDAVFEFIKTSGDFSLMQKRISSSAYNELLAMGQVPGIIASEVTKVGFRKS
tara:strand:+ start:64 stop:477 length:414 start_codon:yes stop_codon:yes gene_type:complete